MSRYVFKLPDLGEGTVAAEIVSWRVQPGDSVAEDDVLVEVMTEKADQRCSTSWLAQCGQTTPPSSLSTSVRVFVNFFLQAWQKNS